MSTSEIPSKAPGNGSKKVLINAVYALVNSYIHSRASYTGK
jgi:hypothetical protein